jgi:aminoglycoside/choline kinase family phosphotransferase
LDAWRGGARLQGRGVAYDLACLLSSLREWLTTEQLDAWLASYSAQRTEHGRPVNPDRLVRRVLKERTALRKRYIRRGRGGELPDV